MPQVQEFIKTCVRTKTPPMSEKWTFASAYSASQLQNCVQKLAAIILRTSMKAKLGFPIYPAKPTELTRVQRTLYRFQIYKYLFTKVNPLGRGVESELHNSEIQLEFLLCFPPWEIEQIACVHDFFCEYATSGTHFHILFHCHTCMISLAPF